MRRHVKENKSREDTDEAQRHNRQGVRSAACGPSFVCCVGVCGFVPSLLCPSFVRCVGYSFVPSPYVCALWCEPAHLSFYVQCGLVSSVGGPLSLRAGVSSVGFFSSVCVIFSLFLFLSVCVCDLIPFSFSCSCVVVRIVGRRVARNGQVQTEGHRKGKSREEGRDIQGR
jgi:hypothetical protein